MALKNLIHHIRPYIRAGVRAGAYAGILGTALFTAGCDSILPDSTDSTDSTGSTNASLPVQDAGAVDGAGNRAGASLPDSSSSSDFSPDSSSGPLDKEVEKYFVRERVERAGMVLGTDAEAEREPNDEGTEYINSIFVEGTPNAVAAAEQASARIKSKILDFYEMILPVTTTEQRDAIRRSLHEQGIETFTSPILKLDGHLDVERAEQAGTNIWAYRRIQLPEALHALGRTDFSDGRAVAVIDSGFKSDELNIVDGYDYADNDDNYAPSPGCQNNNHGTMVAGIIGARQNQNLLNGVAPNIPLYVYKIQDFHPRCVFDDNISGCALLSSLVDAAARRTIAVVNLSMALGDHPLLRRAIYHVMDSGKLVVAAAGNSNKTADHLSAVFPGIVGVGGTQLSADGTEERYLIDAQNGSNYWERGGNWLAAPGRAVAVNSEIYIFPRSIPVIGSDTGTSFSAPLVSGLAALLRSHQLSAEDTYRTMRSSADQLWVSYPDNSQALWHRINAYRAVCSVIPCDEAGGIVDAPPENGDNGDAGRNNGYDAGAERDAGIPEEDAGHIGEGEGEGVRGGEGEGAREGEDIGEGEGEGAQGGEGEGEGDVREPSRYELYVSAVPPAEGNTQLFRVRTHPDCTIDEMVRLTDTPDNKHEISRHHEGILYRIQRGERGLDSAIRLWTPEGVQDIDSGMHPVSSPLDARIAYIHSENGNIHIVEPGQDSILVARVAQENGYTPLVQWYPNSEGIVVMSWTRSCGFYCTNDYSFTFIPLRGFAESFVFDTEKYVSVPVFEDAERLLYLCQEPPSGGRNMGNPFLCEFDMATLHETALVDLGNGWQNQARAGHHFFRAEDGTLYIIAGSQGYLLSEQQQFLSLPIGNRVEANTFPQHHQNPFSPDSRLLVYYGRPDGVDVSGIYLYDRQTEQHCLLLGNATEAVWQNQRE